MKKAIITFLLLTIAAISLSAQSINLGDFPKGKWLDEKWNAMWEFSADNIRILDASSGAVVYDFKDKIGDFKVDVSLTEAKISFSCKDAGRTYVFTKGIKDLNLVMSINPDWSDEDYTVTMPFQK
jgi:major membrane immunogen (membrane-anchored lipoprotein)